MSLTLKHISSRKGVFYYVRRVPQSVLDRPADHARLFDNQTVVRISLKTKDATEAVRRAAREAEEFNRRVAEALGLTHRSTNLVPADRNVTHAVLRNIRLRNENLIVRQFTQYAILREQGGEAAEIADTMIERAGWDAESFTKAFVYNEPTKDPRFDLDLLAKETISLDGLDAPFGSVAFAGVRRAIREGQIEGHRKASEILSGQRSVLQEPDSAPKKACPRLSEAVEAHILTLSKSRTITALRTATRKFTAAVGDRPLDELKAEHFRRYCFDEAMRDVGGKARGSIARPVSSDTIKKDIRLIGAAINGAIDRGEFDGANPASRINPSAFARPRLTSTMPQKRPFQLNELNRIFAYPWFTGCRSPSDIHTPGSHRLDGVFYWGPILALLTGCRAGELGGLALNEVIIDSEQPHIVIRDNEFRTTKGSYRRQVPLLDQLMELGFADFVARRRREGGERLFDDWKPPRAGATTNDPAWSNGRMIRAFNTTLVPRALQGMLMSDARREVTFHSFRGAFKSLLVMNKYGISPNYVHEVVGHSKSELDKRYIGSIPLEETYPAVRGCRYEGLVLPTPP